MAGRETTLSDTSLPAERQASFALRAGGLRKRYGAVTAVDDVSLDVEAGRVVAVLGPSGCGKSTLLRLIAGLETADGGTVTVEERDVTRLPAHRRDIGMVFQDHALFPHLDVEQNVAFGLVEARWSRADAAKRVDELLATFGLATLGRRRVDALSGGERQRVALSRALAPRPRVLLLDEPLASLDRSLRERLASDLARWLHAPGLASIFVTHDQDEAITVGDDLVVMRAGRVAQAGPAEDVVTRPVDPWVARFLGHRNVFEGDLARRLPGGDRHGAVMLRDELVRVRAPRQDARAHATESIVRTVHRDRHGVRIEAWLPEWQVVVSWRGAERELWAMPVAGDAVRLVVPAEAWVPLAPDPDDASPPASPAGEAGPP
jgi:ABC-type Fe3+/spermidine/putrescine transport system ATPase subunit